MAIDFQRQRASFASLPGVQSTVVAFAFPTTVRIAEAAINGYDIGFTNDEHPLLRVRVDTTVISISNNTVRVNVQFFIRDNSGNFDDPYSGFVDVLLIVDRL